MPPLPPATQTLLLLNLAIYCLQVVLGNWLQVLLALWPLGSNFLPFQPVTYAFVHGGWEHLLFNMLGLWMFGGDVELKLGRNRYLTLYFASVLTAAIAQLLLAPLMGSSAPTVGASGALYGLLVGFALLDPDRVIMLLIPPVPMKARTMALIYGAIELYVLLPPFFPGVTFLNYVFGNVAHLAHLGGMLGGLLTIRYWRRQTPFRRPRR